VQGECCMLDCRVASLAVVRNALFDWREERVAEPRKQS